MAIGTRELGKRKASNKFIKKTKVRNRSTSRKRNKMDRRDIGLIPD